MRYDTRLGKYGGKPRPGGLRSTLCISSQVWSPIFPSLPPFELSVDINMFLAD